ncbi:uncharacterized protein [Miscanthus floridulus]|uniref:uncharacterized protein n=1 Tax=Miscanthus floridulus TaxID=154761 RepID=UPI003458ACB1
MTVVALSFSPPLFSLPLLPSSSKCSLHGRQGRTGLARGARGRPGMRWSWGWATGGRGRGHAGPAGDALAAGVGHRRVWPGARGAGRGRASRGGGPPTGVAGGARGRPGMRWPRGWAIGRRGQGAAAVPDHRARRGTTRPRRRRRSAGRAAAPAARGRGGGGAEAAAARGTGGGERKGMRGSRARGKADWAVSGDRTKMVGNRSPRQVLLVYQRLRPPDGGEGTSLLLAARAGPGRPSMGRGRGRGHPRRDPPPSPALDQPKDLSPTPEDHVEATGTTTDTLSGDEGTQQTEDSSAQSAPYLRGAG